MINDFLEKDIKYFDPVKDEIPLHIVDIYDKFMTNDLYLWIKENSPYLHLEFYTNEDLSSVNFQICFYRINFYDNVLYEEYLRKFN